MISHSFTDKELDRSLQLVPRGESSIEFVSESGGRGYALMCPKLMEYFGEQMELMASSQKIDQTVRNGFTLWMTSYINPEFVSKANEVLNSLDVLLKSDRLDHVDEKSKQLFLARVLQWTDAVNMANGLNDCKDFENAKMQMIQKRLRMAGASREYLKVVNFFQDVAKIAFADSGPLFKYPSFGEISELAKTSKNGILMREGGSWTLVPARYKPDQKAVFDELKSIVAAFKDESEKGIPAMMTEEELLYGLALIGQMMTNYLSQIDDAPAVSHQVFRQLAELHSLMYGLLKQRSSSGGLSVTLDEAGKDSLLFANGVLSNVLSDPKFSDFYCKAEGSKLLRQAKKFIKPFITFHLNPGLVYSKHGWEFVSEHKGITLYKTPSEELVVIFNGNNKFWDRKKFDAFAFIGGRGTTFDLDGMVHQQALDNAEEARKSFLAILSKNRTEIGEFSSIKFMGYGLDGATAQLLGQEYKRSHLEVDVTVIGAGVPPFLDEAASASMGLAMTDMEGFKCLNFAMAGDPNIRNLGITGPLGMRYDNTSFTTFPVPQGTVFASEAIKGDHRKAYMAMLETGVFMHSTMRTVFQRTEKAYGLIDSVIPIKEEVKSSPSIELVSDDHLKDGEEFLLIKKDETDFM